jgi:methylmalonyl-CoA mutase
MSNNTSELFNEFPSVSTQQWEDEIVKDLKGADYRKKLCWQTENGFTVKPYYRKEDVGHLDYLTQSAAGEFPFVRTGKKNHNKWSTAQTIDEANPSQANTIALHAVSKGANALCLNASLLKSVKDVKRLLSGISLEEVKLHFFAAPDYVHLAHLFTQYITDSSADKTKIRGAFHFDPIAYLLLHDQFYRSQRDDFAEIVQLLDITRTLPNFACITVCAELLHNCGACIKQELGFGLAMGNAYLTYAVENGISIREIVNKINFSFAISSDYFMEIAKLRTARLLWATIVDAYDPNCQHPVMNIFSRSSRWNKTVFDPYVNMLRTTTEGMSAAIGGADCIDLEAFDRVYKHPDEFSAHIARNTQTILKEEAYFGEVIDPGAGSYYIENLTDQLAEQAWNIFLEVQNEGGMTEASVNGFVKKSIEITCQKRDMELATRRRVLLGTNQYPNLLETMADRINIDASPPTAGLQRYRGAEMFEQLRLKTERYVANGNPCPTVFLLKIGNVAMRQARAGFITNFFGCAGYKIVDNQGFNHLEDAVKAAVEAKANIVVVCSSDEEYPQYVPQIIKQLQEKSAETCCLIAGNPIDSMDTLKQAGVHDFIHVKCNLWDTLKRYNEWLKIE